MAKKKKIEIKTSLIVLLLLAIFILSGLIIVILNISAIKENKLNSISEPIQLNQDETSENNLITDKEKFCEEEGPEMLNYVEQMEVITEKAAQGMARRGEIIKNWADWKQEDIRNFINAGNEIESAYKKAQELIPPEKFSSAHEKILEGLRLWSEGASIGNDGFINKDNDKIQQCLQLTAEGNNYIQEFKEELKEINLN